jgi:hypothetical protein
MWTAVPLLLIGAPWLLQSWQMRGDLIVTETLERLGLIHIRWPKGPIHQLQALLAIAGVWWISKQQHRSQEVVPLLALLGAILVVFNQAIVTNTELEFSNHYSVATNLILKVSLVWMLAHLSWQNVWVQRGTIGALALWVLLQVSVGYQESWQHFYADARAYDERRIINDVSDALNALPREQVIVTPLGIAMYVPVYTTHYPFLSHMSRLMPVADDELIRRAALQRQLFPDDPISERVVVGTRHINLAVHRRIECRVLNLLPFRHHDCEAITPAQFLPSRWQDYSQAPPLSPEALRDELAARHVGYVLAESIPRDLEQWLEVIDAAGPYNVYQLR